MRLGRKGSKTVLLSPRLSVYIHSAAGMVLPGLNIHIRKVDHSGKLQIVDLLCLRQLNEAILLFNSILFDMFGIFTLLEQPKKI